MDLFDAIAKRASVRAYDPVEIPDGDLERIVDAGRRAPSGGNRQPLQFVAITKRETLQALVPIQEAFASAAAAVGIVADPAVSRWWLEDASAAAQNMLLAITALGYASVWIEGTLLKQEDRAKDLLGVPKEKRLIILLPIGKAPADASQAEKKPLEDVMFRERYGGT
ncbi:MAG: nitroreductase family protein [Phycisphaerae bacterium]